MLQWATGGEAPGLGLLVLHDDAEREFAYGPANGLPDSQIGTFSQALMDTAKAHGRVRGPESRDWRVSRKAAGAACARKAARVSDRA